MFGAGLAVGVALGVLHPAGIGAHVAAAARADLAPHVRQLLLGRHLLRELEEAESSLSELAVNPRGRLRIDIHGAPAQAIVLPRIREFHERYPHIELVMGSGDRLVDLLREGVDCVVRAGEPKDSSLVTRRLALLPQVTCASPGYLAEYGTPTQPSELARHLGVNFFSASRPEVFPYEFLVDGKLETYMLKDWISVNNADLYKI